MVEGRRKSRTLRRVFVKTPGGRTVVHYRKRKPGKAQCGGCGAFLHGMPHVLASRKAKLPKTARRPERPFGGVYCSRCSRAQLVMLARAVAEAQ